ncbi:hypothetical protein [Ideonella sp.]|uniref:hypothetical protein n=1 Tax=Ideonella sp. TaxID=1929293 RepID=UPI002B464128|nr:hypothetical protein [Ideonella sp.]HJV69952.1 hypothetical protein [Ideonella sp.]
MLGRNKPVVFDPYGRRRTRRGLPSWFWLLLIGTLAGVTGVLYLQERVLPPRLSQDDSAALRSRFDEADAERLRLRSELADTKQRLDAALADKTRLTAELAANRSTTDDLKADVASLVATLPPDPRDNGVEVRAGRFSASGSTLDYDVVLTRERSAAKPFTGVMQLVVAGDPARGGSSSFSAKPVPVSIRGHEIVRGRIELPDGFKPRQTTVQVLDREAGKSLGMRVLLVK